MKEDSLVILIFSEPGALNANSFSYYGLHIIHAIPRVKLVQLKKIMNQPLLPHELTTEAQNRNFIWIFRDGTRKSLLGMAGKYHVYEGMVDSYGKTGLKDLDAQAVSPLSTGGG